MIQIRFFHRTIKKSPQKILLNSILISSLAVLFIILNFPVNPKSSLPIFNLSELNNSLNLQNLILFGKPLWDWISLLGAPIILTIFGFTIQGILKQQDERRRKLDESINETYLQNEAIRQYLDQVMPLFSRIDSKENFIAIKVLTTTALKRLNLEKREEILFFLRSLRVLERSESRESIFSQSYLKGIDFTGNNLSGADLSDSAIEGRNFTGSNLSNVDFSNIKFDNLDFENINFEGSNFSGTTLINANFKDSNLSKANFSYSYINGANFDNTNLSGVIFNHTQFSFEYDLLEDANLKGADLKNLDLQKANLSGADLESSTIFYVSFKQADLHKASFKNSSLINVNFEQLDRKKLW